jgi:pimeloyl-ACP methyl ester carboxylesterase
MKKFRKILRWTGIVVVVLSVIYLLGPKPDTPKFSPVLPVIKASGAALDTYIAQEESTWNVKPDNEARIIWANDSIKDKTDYAIVYLHGFSASPEEGNPTHVTTAKTFGCNLYLSRLSMHGLDTTEQLLGLSPDNYWESAKKALVIGQKLGKKVILMGTSTGGTQALQLAAAFPDQVNGLILLSPNIEVNNPNAWLLNNPWGLQIARMVMGGNYVTPSDTTKVYKKYWNTPYRLEATVALEEMVEATMKPATFQKITQPILLLYYYKDEQNQDPVVKVDAMLEMFNEVSTPITLKRKIAIPNAGNHVLGSPIKSGDVPSVISNTTGFMKEIMKMQEVQ